LKGPKREALSKAIKQSAEQADAYREWAMKQRKLPETHQRFANIPEALDEKIRDRVEFPQEMKRFKTELRDAQYRREIEQKLEMLEIYLNQLLDKFLSAIVHLHDTQEIKNWKQYELSGGWKKDIYNFVKFAHIKSEGLKRLNNLMGDGKPHRKISGLKACFGGNEPPANPSSAPQGRRQMPSVKACLSGKAPVKSSHSSSGNLPSTS
jgi:hypothetical protein